MNGSVILQYLYEKDLKNKFWEQYSKRKSVLKHQFECQAREGGVDLLTVEDVQGDYQFCAFEFKLSDVKKALAQAEANLSFVHKSFIVLPVEKEELIHNRYLSYLREKRYIGVIGVDQNGRWKMLHQPYAQHNVVLNQSILKLIIRGF